MEDPRMEWVTKFWAWFYENIELCPECLPVLTRDKKFWELMDESVKYKDESAFKRHLRKIMGYLVEKYSFGKRRKDEENKGS